MVLSGSDSKEVTHTNSIEEASEVIVLEAIELAFTWELVAC